MLKFEKGLKFDGSIDIYLFITIPLRNKLKSNDTLNRYNNASQRFSSLNKSSKQS